MTTRLPRTAHRSCGAVARNMMAHRAPQVGLQRKAARNRRTWPRALGLGILVSLCGAPDARASGIAPAILWHIPTTNHPNRATTTALATEGAEVTYAAGTFSGSFDFGGITLTNLAGTASECFVGRWSADGRADWVNPIRGTNLVWACSMAAASGGGALVLGPFLNRVDFGTTNLSGPSGPEEGALFLARYGSDGALSWARTLARGRIRPPEFGNLDGRPAVCLAGGPGGELRIAGVFDETMTLGGQALTGGNGDIFLARCDEVGDVIWARVLGGNGVCSALLLAVHGNGDLILSGGFTGAIDLGGTNVVGDGRFIARYDAAGHLLWGRRLAPTAIAADVSGATYASGQYSGPEDFPDLANPDPHGASTGIYLARLGPAGETVWLRILSSAPVNREGLGLACDPAGDIYWLARFTGAGAIFGEADFYSRSGAQVLARYRPDGELVWAMEDPWEPCCSIGMHLDVGSTGNAMLGGQGRLLARVAANDAESPVTIRRQPAAIQVVHAGEDAVLDVIVSGAEPRSYQWQDRSLDLPGATNRSLTLTNVQDPMGGLYWVVVSNRFGAVTSTVATLRVATNSNPPGFVWARQGGGYGGRNFEEGGRAVCADGSGAVYLAADYALWARFESQALAAHGTAGYALAKYAPDGTLSWLRRSPGTGTDYARGVAVDPAGNVYVTGTWEHQDGDFFGAPDPVNASRFLAKYGASGDLIWARPTGGAAVTAARADALFVLGDQWGGTSLGHTNLTESGGFAARYDAGGDCRWLHLLPGVIWGVGRPAADNAGGLVAGGYFETNTVVGGVILTNLGPGQGAFIARFHEGGALDWVREGSWRSLYPRIHLAVGAEGAVYGATDFQGSFQLGDTHLTSGNLLQGALFRLTASGQVDWVLAAVGQPGSGPSDPWCQITSVALDPSEHLYAVGRFHGRMLLGTFSFDSHSPAGWDAFVARFDRQGRCLGARQIGGGTAVSLWAVAVDPLGYAVVAGDLGTTLDEPGFATGLGPTVLVGRGFTDPFLAKLDTALPVLEATRSDHELVLSWPARWPDLSLESAGAVPGGSWNPRADPVTESAGRFEVRLPGGAPAQFFRLRGIGDPADPLPGRAGPVPDP